MSGHRKALIVANDEYEQEALRNLLAPVAGAEALGRVLADPEIGDFAVQVVRNEPSYVIQAQIEELFSESRPDDVLLLHFSGHRLKSESGELFFAASNTRPNRLGSTAVSADFVERCMRASRSRSVVLLLDCRDGGAFAQESTVRAAGDVNVLDSFPLGRLSGGRGRAVITASDAMEYAFEGDWLADDQHRRPSVFTSALVEGLSTGDADRDEDGWVSLDELYDYVFDKIQEQNPHQTPSRQVELEGELYLARSRRRRIRPAPIPPDLQAAIHDPNMYSRRVTYDELAAWAYAQLVQPGRLLFNPPNRMQLGETERVEVRLIRTLELDAKLLEGLRGYGKPQLEEISTAPLMSVTLKSEGFNITAYSDEEQSVVQDRPATWEFDIRALKRGQQNLVMCVNLRIPVPGAPSERISKPVREAMINVQVGTVALVGQFVSSHWAWLVGTVIAIIGVVVAAILH